MRRYLTVFVTTILATTICFAASASASTRYAAPDGVGSPVECLQSDPCSLPDAATNGWTEPGDVVILAPGTYALTDTLVPDGDIELRGTGAPPATTITSTVTDGDVISGYFGNQTFTDLRIIGHVDGAALDMDGGTMRRVIATNTGQMACRMQNGDAFIVNSVCATSAPGTTAMYLFSANHATQHVRLRGVTAVNTSGSGRGISVNCYQDASIAIDAKSVIASGGATDVDSSAGSSAGSTATVVFDHSNYDSVTNWNGATTTPAGSDTNQTYPVTFADPAAFDLSVGPDSSTINHGDFDDYSDITDVLGNPRVQGDYADIGAYEWDLGAPDAPAITGPSDGAVVTGWPEISGTAEPGVKVSLMTSQGYGALVYADDSGNWSVGGLGMEPGDLTITVRAGDEHGNWSGEVHLHLTYVATPDPPTPPASGPDSGSPSSPLTPLPDNAPPALTLSAKPKATSTSTNFSLKFGASEAGSKFICKLDSGRYKPCTSPFKKRVKVGKHKLTIVAIDAAGNVSKPTVVKWRVVKR